MGFKFPVKPRTRAILTQLANPSLPGQSEAVPWVFFDTQNFVSGTTTRLTFFQTTSPDRSITNMVTAGSLPHPQFFEWYYIGLDILQRPSSSADITGAWDNVIQLILSTRGHWTFTMSDKILGQFPLTFLHASGGVTGFAASAGATTTANIQYANNAIFDGGWCLDGSIIIPPKVGFNIEFQWPSTFTLTGNLDLRCWIAGTLHRRVL